MREDRLKLRLRTGSSKARMQHITLLMLMLMLIVAMAMLCSVLRGESKQFRQPFKRSSPSLATPPPLPSHRLTTAAVSLETARVALQPRHQRILEIDPTHFSQLHPSHLPHSQPSYTFTSPSVRSIPTSTSSPTQAQAADNPSPSATILLTDSFHVMYTATVSIGSPAQYFEVILDTGSSCLWVMSAEATRKVPFLHYYDSTASSSYSKIDTYWEIQYGVGQCHGFLSNETVALSALTVHNQTFAQATSLSANFLNPNQPLDGILGMSFAGGACTRFPTFLDNLYDQKVINHKLFSFHLDKSEEQREIEEKDISTSGRNNSASSSSNTRTSADGNEVIFGEIDYTLFEGNELAWSPVLHAPGKRPHMWFVHLEELKVDEEGKEEENSTVNDNSSSGPGEDRNASHQNFADKIHLNRHKNMTPSQRRQDLYRHILSSTSTNTDPSSSPPSIGNTPLPPDLDSDEQFTSKAPLTFCTPLTGPCIALPDTGTSFLTLPTRLFIFVIERITRGREDCVMDTFMNVFCLDAPSVPLPSLTFTFHSTPFALISSDYVLPNKQLAIQLLDFGLSDLNVLILGDVFLRSVYVVFDAENDRIGMGKSTNQPAKEGGIKVGGVLMGVRRQQVGESKHHHSDIINRMWEDKHQREEERLRIGLGVLTVLGGLLLICFIVDWCVQAQRRKEYEAIPVREV